MALFLTAGLSVEAFAETEADDLPVAEEDIADDSSDYGVNEPVAEIEEQLVSSSEASEESFEVSAEDEIVDLDGRGIVEDYASSSMQASPQEPVQGWEEVDGEHYYCIDGARIKGSHYVDGKWHRFDLADGRMLTGWQSIDGKRYYYDPATGAMLFENRCIDGEWYWFDMNAGFMWTGSANIYGKWYRYDLADGRMLTGSQFIDGSWYRYDPQAGYMHFGSTFIDGSWYWYDLWNGKMLFGWQDIYGHDYFYDRVDGKMYFEGHYVDGSWRFFDTEGGFLNRQAGIDRVMKVARSLLGVPYIWDGSYPEDGGMDCSSFTWYVYQQLGVNIGEDTYHQIYDGSHVSSLSQAKPGDLILMYFNAHPNYDPKKPEHVVLYAGNGMIYEEPNFGGHCQYVSLASKHASTVEIRRILRD